jgi:cell division protein FtsB
MHLIKDFYVTPNQRHMNWKKIFIKLNVSAIIPIVLLIILIFLIGGLLFKETGILKVKEVTDIKAQLEKEIVQLEEENKKLATEILSLRADPFWTEKIAREELDMVKSGEIVVKFRE